MEPRISIITLGVSDMDRSFTFYADGLDLPTTGSPDKGIVFFQLSGTCLAIHPREKLAEDVDPEMPPEGEGFSGITIAHNTREKHQVDELLEQAGQAGGRIVKPAQDASWGGYSGYFADPDGHLWEVAWAEAWEFHDDGSLVIE
jgi:catechol 2,3-dioxygenase-like lactoylglutathione lyase family enzyme